MLQEEPQKYYPFNPGRANQHWYTTIKEGSLSGQILFGVELSSPIRTHQLILLSDDQRIERYIVAKRPSFNAPLTRDKQQKDIHAEIEALRAVQGRDILPLTVETSTYPASQDTYTYFITDVARGKALQEWHEQLQKDGKEFPIHTALALLSRFAHVLDRAHTNQFIYNDSKLDHLFWDPQTDQFTIIDWGNARVIDADYLPERDLKGLVSLLAELTTRQQIHTKADLELLPRPSSNEQALVQIYTLIHHVWDETITTAQQLATALDKIARPLQQQQKQNLDTLRVDIAEVNNLSKSRNLKREIEHIIADQVIVSDELHALRIQIAQKINALERQKGYLLARSAVSAHNWQLANGSFQNVQTRLLAEDTLNAQLIKLWVTLTDVLIDYQDNLLFVDLAQRLPQSADSQTAIQPLINDALDRIFKANTLSKHEAQRLRPIENLLSNLSNQKIIYHRCQNLYEHLPTSTANNRTVDEIVRRTRVTHRNTIIYWTDWYQITAEQLGNLHAQFQFDPQTNAFLESLHTDTTLLSDQLASLQRDLSAGLQFENDIKGRVERIIDTDKSNPHLAKLGPITQQLSTSLRIIPTSISLGKEADREFDRWLTRSQNAIETQEQLLGKGLSSRAAYEDLKQDRDYLTLQKQNRSAQEQKKRLAKMRSNAQRLTPRAPHVTQYMAHEIEKVDSQPRWRIETQYSLSKYTANLEAVLKGWREGKIDAAKKHRQLLNRSEMDRYERKWFDWTGDLLTHTIALIDAPLKSPPIELYDQIVEIYPEAFSAETRLVSLWRTAVETYNDRTIQTASERQAQVQLAVVNAIQHIEAQKGWGKSYRTHIEKLNTSIANVVQFDTVRTLLEANKYSDALNYLQSNQPSNMLEATSWGDVEQRLNYIYKGWADWDRGDYDQAKKTFKHFHETITITPIGNPILQQLQELNERCYQLVSTSRREIRQAFDDTSTVSDEGHDSLTAWLPLLEKQRDRYAAITQILGRGPIANAPQIYLETHHQFEQIVQLSDETYAEWVRALPHQTIEPHPALPVYKGIVTRRKNLAIEKRRRQIEEAEQQGDERDNPPPPRIRRSVWVLFAILLLTAFALLGYQYIPGLIAKDANPTPTEPLAVIPSSPPEPTVTRPIEIVDPTRIPIETIPVTPIETNSPEEVCQEIIGRLKQNLQQHIENNELQDLPRDDCDDLQNALEQEGLKQITNNYNDARNTDSQEQKLDFLETASQIYHNLSQILKTITPDSHEWEPNWELDAQQYCIQYERSILLLQSDEEILSILRELLSKWQLEKDNFWRDFNVVCIVDQRFKGILKWDDIETKQETTQLPYNNAPSNNSASIYWENSSPKFYYRESFRQENETQASSQADIITAQELAKAELPREQYLSIRNEFPNKLVGIEINLDAKSNGLILTNQGYGIVVEFEWALYKTVVTQQDDESYLVSLQTEKSPSILQPELNDEQNLSWEQSFDKEPGHFSIIFYDDQLWVLVDDKISHTVELQGDNPNIGLYIATTAASTTIESINAIIIPNE